MLPRDGSPFGIAFDGSNYLVTFTEEGTFPNACPATGYNWEAYGILVAKSGAATGSGFVLGNTTTRAKVFPLPVYLGTQYVVTWTDGMGTASSYVKGQYVSTTGAASGAEFTLFSPASSGAIPWLGMVYAGGGANLTVSNWGIPDAIAPGNMDLYTSADVMGSILDSSTTNPGGGAWNMSTGWNLLGNGVNDATVNVATTFGDATKVVTVWKWIAASSKWAFYTPIMNTADLGVYAAGKGYDVLTTINAGEGFWVNSK